MQLQKKEIEINKHNKQFFFNIGTILLMIVRRIHFEIPLTQQTKPPWLSMSFSNQQTERNKTN